MKNYTKRHATAVWNGSVLEGHGHLTTQSTTLNQTQYSFNSRFADGMGTNPEELMAAAHAGCFTMKLSNELTTAGFTPDMLETTATITLENSVITNSDLVLSAKIKGISEEQFQQIAAIAKAECPVSKAYNLKISLQASLIL
jgi:osmotically inducible protein OsmC